MSKKIQNRNLFFRKKAKSPAFRSYVLWLVAVVGLFYGAVFLLPVVPTEVQTPDIPVFKVKIKPQSSLASVANQLQEQGISSYSLFTQISARALFLGSALKPGTYILPSR
jgi:UPF0755 protein